ncbi:MAG TPA: hypothetical protein VGB03_07915 [Acidimicrobiales bacterium]
MTGRGIHRDEDGAVLVMALVFLSVAGLLVAALLSFSDTNFRTTIAVREQRNVVYAADGAVDAAVNYYRTHLGSGSPCPPPAAVPAVNGVTGLTVSCTAGSTVSGAPTNAPKLAVIARASTGEDGITLVSGALTAVRGGVYSNTSISVSGGTELYVEAPNRVVTRSGCTGAGADQVGPAPCEMVSGAYPDGDDPGYGKVPATAPTPFVTAPTCPATEPVVFPQGTYTSRAALEAFMATCGRRTFHFPAAGGIGSPGVYYFDFADDTQAWTIPAGYTVVGGTFPTGVTGATVASSPAGARCDDNAEGVQLLFGGASRIVAQGVVELCAPYSDPSSTTPRVALYGIKSSDPVPVAPTPQTLTLNPTATAPAGTPFQPPTGATKPNDGSVAVAPVPRDASSAVTVSGFDLSSVPATATINSAAFVVRHAENESPASASPNFNRLELQATATSGVLSYTAQSKACGATPNCTRSLSTSASMTDDPSGGVALPATFNVRSVLSALGVTYRATSTGAAYSSSLDGVSLLVTYTPAAPPAVPLFRAQSGCITVTPYGQPANPSSVIAPTSPCALVTTSGINASLAVKGTVYAPNAALDIQLVQASYQVFGRGIIVRTLRSNVTSSSACNVTPPFADPACYPFQLPATTINTGDVLFVATHQGRVRLRALVRFPSAAATPVIKAWSVVNET